MRGVDVTIRSFGVDFHRENVFEHCDFPAIQKKAFVVVASEEIGLQND